MRADRPSPPRIDTAPLRGGAGGGSGPAPSLQPRTAAGLGPPQTGRASTPGNARSGPPAAPIMREGTTPTTIHRTSVALTLLAIGMLLVLVLLQD